MRERLAHLSVPAREAVIVAASLGRRFSFTDMAEMLDRPTPDLLAPVGELLDADLFIERDAKLAFWHDITREAVRAASRSVHAARWIAKPRPSCWNTARFLLRSRTNSLPAPSRVTR